MEIKEKKLTRRSLQREYIVAKLYQYDMTDDVPDIKKNNPFIKDSIRLIIRDLEAIDTVIKESLVNWSLNRLSYVDRAIMRLATFELSYTDTPHEIIINEALELTKKFSDEGDKKHVSFNNKVLDNISRIIKKKA